MEKTVTLPVLAAGETYAGIILREDGTPSHHLILLKGDRALTWDKAKAFAEKAGGELPSRNEQPLLFANCKKQFKPDWYWSNTQHASGADYAWDQDFGSGGQLINDTSYEGRARAVRRLAI